MSGICDGNQIVIERGTGWILILVEIKNLMLFFQMQYTHFVENYLRLLNTELYGILLV